MAAFIRTKRLLLPIKRFKICHMSLFSLDLDRDVLNEHYNVTEPVTSPRQNTSIGQVESYSTPGFGTRTNSYSLKQNMKWTLSLSTMNRCRPVDAISKPSSINRVPNTTNWASGQKNLHHHQMTAHIIPIPNGGKKIELTVAFT